MPDTPQSPGPLRVHLPVESLTTRYLGLASFLYMKGWPVKAVATPGRSWVMFTFPKAAEADAKEFKSPTTRVQPAEYYQAAEDLRAMLQQARAAAGRAS